MQNPFYVGDDISISSSDGESVTIEDVQGDEINLAVGSVDVNDEDNISVTIGALQGSAAQQQSATEARRGQRARMPRTLFQSE